MAEDRDQSQQTEEPTQKRLDEALKKADIVKSTEVASVAVLAGGTLALALFAQSTMKTFLTHNIGFLQSPETISVDAQSMGVLLRDVVFGFFVMMAPAAGLLLLAAIGGHVLQHRPMISTEKLKPDLGRLSLIAGFNRLFGIEGVINLIKGIAKIALVGSAAMMAVWPSRARLGSALDLNPAGVTALAGTLIAKVLMAAIMVLVVIAALDYFHQWQRFMARHRMSRQELKDEHKQNEGDPHIKARIRQIRIERTRRRMMAAVPKATVVITNPTHYAVALLYESGKTDAPVCVAKGADHLALKIRKVAEDNAVPIIENPPLARALYAAVEIDDEIPPEHYKACAQIIGYVLKLASRNKFWRN